MEPAAPTGVQPVIPPATEDSLHVVPRVLAGGIWGVIEVHRRRSFVSCLCVRGLLRTLWLKPQLQRNRQVFSLLALSVLMACLWVLARHRATVPPPLPAAKPVHPVWEWANQRTGRDAQHHDHMP